MRVCSVTDALSPSTTYRPRARTTTLSEGEVARTVAARVVREREGLGNCTAPPYAARVLRVRCVYRVVVSLSALVLYAPRSPRAPGRRAAAGARQPVPSQQQQPAPHVRTLSLNSLSLSRDAARHYGSATSHPHTPTRALHSHSDSERLGPPGSTSRDSSLSPSPRSSPVTCVK